MKVQAARYRTISLLLAVLGVCWSGCVGGPHALQISRSKFNRAIITTDKEEMLLNLVRLKYREPPKFVDLAAVTEQFVFSGDGGIGATIPEGGLDVLALSLNGSASERPTITYTPQHGEEFNRRLLSPISIDTMSLLSLTGWRIDKVLRVTVQSINDVYNAATPTGPSGDMRPEYEEFLVLAGMLRQLQIQKQMELIYAPSEAAPVSPPVPREQILAADLIEAAAAGYSFRAVETADEEAGKENVQWQLYSPEEYRLVLRFDPAALNSPEVTTIVDLLRLKEPRSLYTVEPAAQGQLQFREANRARNRENLSVARRSFLEIMYFLSHGITVPEEHREEGLVVAPRDYDGSPFDWRNVTGDLFQIRSSDHCPSDAAVAVPYRGHWFYIADDDLSSKSTFALLMEIYNIEMRGGGGAGVPVLTLGVGN